MSHLGAAFSDTVCSVTPPEYACLALRHIGQCVAPPVQRCSRPLIRVASSAILDGEVICLDADGRSNFHKLLFRTEWPNFCAFDLLKVDGRYLRNLPLIERKIRLKAILPNVESRLRYVDHIEGSGREFFRLAYEHDLEGIVGKWRFGNLPH